MNPWRRVQLALASVTLVFVGGTVGYVVLGFGVLDALYQTITTVTTVGFREVEPFTDAGKLFTVVLILIGAATVLTTFSVVVEALFEGHIRDQFGRRRMERKVTGMAGHVILCGWGRVGQSLAEFVHGARGRLVVIDNDPARLTEVRYPTVLGDATDDTILKRAGIDRARALVTALPTDADNLFVTLTGRSLQPKLFIVARARTGPSEEKLRRAGADRVVNPQAIGGQRMAAFVLQPHVAEFVDVVMHNGSLEFRLEEVVVPEGSPLAGQTIRAAHLRDRTGALVLAIRHHDGAFSTNPDPETVINEGDILIVVGTADQLARLGTAVLA
ncbi:MAG TPA: potassium channel protein [Acidimicrobiales bacterium]|nr:potassium channel protein [Acidimicrobiales bacterium]